MKLEQYQETQLSLCLRMVQELSYKQTKENLSDQQKRDLQHFRQRKRELLTKLKKEYE